MDGDRSDAEADPGGEPSESDLALAKGGDREAMCRVAYSLYASDPATAVIWDTRAAELGQTSAMHNLGVYFRDSDPDQAVMWWRQGAEAGHLAAIESLAWVLEKRDPVEAVRWFEKAAELGSVWALNHLGRFYWTRDRRLSRYWYERAAKEGDAMSMYYLALLLDPFYVSTVWRGARQAAARRWLEQAATLGHVPAQVHLGTQLVFRHRLGVGASEYQLALARDWFKRAADAGDRGAMHALAVLVGNWDPITAMEWDQKAARLGDGWAALNYSMTVGLVDPSRAIDQLEETPGTNPSRDLRLLMKGVLLFFRALQRRQRRQSLDGHGPSEDDRSLDERVNESWEPLAPPTRAAVASLQALSGLSILAATAMKWAWRTPGVKTQLDKLARLSRSHT